MPQNFIKRNYTKYSLWNLFYLPYKYFIKKTSHYILIRFFSTRNIIQVSWAVALFISYGFVNLATNYICFLPLAARKALSQTALFKQVEFCSKHLLNSFPLCFILFSKYFLFTSISPLTCFYFVYFCKLPKILFKTK